MLGHRVCARLDPDGWQTAEVVVDRGYHPNLIAAVAGRPVRLGFRRLGDDPCTERVVFSTPRIDRPLSTTGITVVDLPALEPGDVLFTCGMGRYRGHIEILRDRSSGRAGWLRDRVSRFGPEVMSALVLWVASLVPIALLAMLLLDPAAAIVLSSVTPVALIVFWLWASGHSNAAT